MSRPSLAGNGYQEAKYAGENHGSHRIAPWSVWMWRPAWPIDVTRMCLPKVERYRGLAAGPA